MSNYVGKTLSAQGSLEIGKELGKGGEGSVYEVTSHSIDDLPEASELVAKIYHEPNEGGRAAKVVAMLKMPPESTSVAWPLAVIAENGSFVGYLMQKLDYKNYRSWAELSNTKDRRGTSADFDVQYALATSRNLAVAILSIHDAGHRVGDVNESNIFIGTDAGVFIVDTDSAQIQGPNGKTYRCLVGKMEFTSPELSHTGFKNQDRTVESDVYAYAVSIFQMLTGGAHPTDGIYLKKDDPPATVEKIRQGILPGIAPEDAKRKGFKPAPRIPSFAMPSRIQKLLVRCLSVDPKLRPGMEEIVSVLDDVLMNLEKCSKIKSHWYDSRDGSCGWCKHLESGNLDPWSAEKPKPKSAGIPQTKLPSVSFNDGSNQAPLKARRAAPTVNGQNSSGNSQGNMQNPSQQFPNNPNHQYNYAQVPHPNQQQGNMSGQNYPNPNFNPNMQMGNNGFGNSPQNVQQQEERELPKKSRRGKMILDYADGSRRERPPLSRLVAQGNAKMALYCLKEETPVIFQAWWNPSRKVAIIWGLLVGFVVSLFISASWFYTIPMLAANAVPNVSFIPPEIQTMIFYYFAMASSITAALGCLYLMSSGLYDMFTAKRQYGSLSGLKREKPWITALRFIPISIFYGPFFLIILIIASIMGLFSLMGAIGRNTR